MKKLFLVLLVLMVAGAGWFYYRQGRLRLGGPRIHVLFDERHDLSPGDPVTLKGVEIGRVESVELVSGRIRATLRLDGARGHEVPRDSLFKVESGGFLVRRTSVEAHVLDATSAPLEDGESVEGVDSAAELLIKKGARRAREMIDELAKSDWLARAAELAGEIERMVQDVDWDAAERDVRENVAELLRQMKEAAAKSEEAARREYERLKPQFERLNQDLERLGRSEEARELRERLRKLWPDA
jgi:hypothetical protein